MAKDGCKFMKHPPGSNHNHADSSHQEHGNTYSQLNVEEHHTIENNNDKDPNNLNSKYGCGYTRTPNLGQYENNNTIYNNANTNAYDNSQTQENVFYQKDSNSHLNGNRQTTNYTQSFSTSGIKNYAKTITQSGKKRRIKL